MTAFAYRTGYRWWTFEAMRRASNARIVLCEISSRRTANCAASIKEIVVVYTARTEQSRVQTSSTGFNTNRAFTLIRISRLWASFITRIHIEQIRIITWCAVSSSILACLTWINTSLALSNISIHSWRTVRKALSPIIKIITIYAGETNRCCEAILTWRNTRLTLWVRVLKLPNWTCQDACIIIKYISSRAACTEWCWSRASLTVWSARWTNWSDRNISTWTAKLTRIIRI